MEPAGGALRAERERRDLGFKALQRITVAVRSRIDLHRVLDSLVTDAGRFLDLTLCSLARWDVSGDHLAFSHEFRRDHSGAPAVTIQGRRLTPGADPEVRRFEELLFVEHRPFITGGRRPGAAGSAPEELDALPAPLLPLSRLSAVVAPMLADQRVTGILVAARHAQLPAWSDEEIEFLRTAADIAAVAVHHAAMRSHIRTLSAVAAKLNSHVDLATLLRRLTEAAMIVTQSTMGVSGLREGDEMVCREMRRQGRWDCIDVRFTRDRGLPGWAWTNRVPCIANDAAADRRADSGLIAQYGVHSALTVPIVDADGEVLGFFELQNKAAGIPYDDEDVHLASALAHHAAVALNGRDLSER